MTGDAYFVRLYAASVDPWRLATSPYERAKRQALLDALPRPRYRNAFEPACAIGVTTVELARRCDRLVALDLVPDAVEQARERVRRYAGRVCIRVGRIPSDWPDETFDLIVLSEMLYYLSSADREAVADLAVQTLDADGNLVLVHWRHPFAEATTTGDEAQHELVGRVTVRGLRVVAEDRHADYTLQVLGHNECSRAVDEA